MSPPGAKGSHCLLHIIKDQSSLLYNATNCMFKHPSGPICLTPVRSEDKENWWKYANSHATCCAMSNKALTQESQMTASMKLQQAKTLVCKLGKMSDPSQLLASRQTDISNLSYLSLVIVQFSQHFNNFITLQRTSFCFINFLCFLFFILLISALTIIIFNLHQV